MAVSQQLFRTLTPLTPGTSCASLKRTLEPHFPHASPGRALGAASPGVLLSLPFPRTPEAYFHPSVPSQRGLAMGGGGISWEQPVSTASQPRRCPSCALPENHLHRCCVTRETCVRPAHLLPGCQCDCVHIWAPLLTVLSLSVSKWPGKGQCSGFWFCSWCCLFTRES